MIDAFIRFVAPFTRTTATYTVKGNSPAFEQARTNQKAWMVVEHLIKTSNFSRVIHVDHRYDEIFSKKDSYTIEILSNTMSPVLDTIHALLSTTFSKEEVDPKAKFLKQIEDNEISIYLIMKEEIESFLIGRTIPIQGTQMDIFMIDYAATVPKYRQHSLARELYLSALIDACIQSESRGRELIMAGGECVPTSEHYWNNVGWKRIYLKASDTTYEEATYFCPPANFDPHTGDPSEGYPPVAEHFMIMPFHVVSLSKELLINLVTSFQRISYQWPESAFDSTQAYEQHLSHIHHCQQLFQDSMQQYEQIELLNNFQRRMKKKRLHMHFIEHPEDAIVVGENLVLSRENF